jgi:hypothetical protein
MVDLQGPRSWVINVFSNRKSKLYFPSISINNHWLTRPDSNRDRDNRMPIDVVPHLE